MAPVRTLDEIVAEARLAKLSRDYRRAAGLYTEAARSPEAAADPEKRASLFRRAAACTYLDPGTRKEQRSREAVALLERELELPEIDARLKLAKALKGELSFGNARTELAAVRRLIKAEWKASLADGERKARLAATEREATQQHGLCTYKDVDLPPGDRLDDALNILSGTDPLAIDGVENLQTTLDPETLGIAGAVHKAKWKLDSQRSHLERALWFYDRGYTKGRDGAKCGIAADNGYTAINTAYILDLLASLEETDLGSDDPSVAERRQRARKIRAEIVETLPQIADDTTKGQWWYAATLAEAEFGLGRFEEAAERLEKARRSTGVEEWEFESTARQLASLLNLLPGDGVTGERARKAFARGFGVSPITSTCGTSVTILL